MGTPARLLATVLAGLCLPLGSFCAGPTEMPYWIDSCPSEESSCQPTDRELAEWAVRAWERAAGGLLKFTPAKQREDSVLRFRWVTEREGLYGEARPIVVKGRQGAELFIRPGMDGLGDDIAGAARKDPLLRDAIVYLTCLHEAGHGLGLRHTSAFADIMYSFGYGGDIVEYFGRYRKSLKAPADIAINSGMSPADEAALRLRWK